MRHQQNRFRLFNACNQSLDCCRHWFSNFCIFCCRMRHWQCEDVGEYPRRQETRELIFVSRCRCRFSGIHIVFCQLRHRQCKQIRLAPHFHRTPVAASSRRYQNRLNIFCSYLFHLRCWPCTGIRFFFVLGLKLSSKHNIHLYDASFLSFTCSFLSSNTVYMIFLPIAITPKHICVDTYSVKP